MSLEPPSNRAIIWNLAVSAACLTGMIGWILLAAPWVPDSAVGAAIVVTPALIVLGAGAIYFSRAVSALGSKFLKSMGIHKP